MAQALPLGHQLACPTDSLPRPGTYFPWSDGPQNCPGAKFSKVEVVAVLAYLLRDHQVGIVREAGESFEEAKARALRTVEDCDLQLLLRMRNPDKIRLEWQPA